MGVIDLAQGMSGNEGINRTGKRAVALGNTTTADS
jgi:hypothetical protein